MVWDGLKMRFVGCIMVWATFSMVHGLVLLCASWFLLLFQWFRYSFPLFFSWIRLRVEVG